MSCSGFLIATHRVRGGCPTLSRLSYPALVKGGATFVDEVKNGPFEPWVGQRALREWGSLYLLEFPCDATETKQSGAE